jgi:hypothetical protein
MAANQIWNASLIPGQNFKSGIPENQGEMATLIIEAIIE